MAKIRKRGNSYQIDYFDPEGKRVRQSFKKKKDAEAELGKRVSLVAEGRYLDVKKDYTTTVQELLDAYRENYQHQASYASFKSYCLAKFKEQFGADTKLANIRYVDLETYRNYLRQQPIKGGALTTVASVNREMSCIHHLFSKGVEWEMIERSPFDRGKPLLLKENNKRMRYLTEDEIDRLLEVCVNQHTRDIVTATINTGMRRQEVCNLKWNQVREDGFLYLDKTKTDEARQVPINEDLAELFREIRHRNQLRSEFVFCDKEGQHVKSKGVSSSFNSSIRKAGIEDFVFRDLRHTFASHFIMRGGSLKELQEILGHKTMTMTLRYAHLSKEHKKKAVSLLNGLTCHKTGTFEKPASQPADLKR
jgi:integrase